MSASDDFSKVRAEFRREIRGAGPRPDWTVLVWAVVMAAVISGVTAVAVVFG